MTRHHMTENGPKPCPAKIQCRLKGPDGEPVEHFPTKKEAMVAYTDQLKAERAGQDDTMTKRGSLSQGDAKNSQGTQQPATEKVTMGKDPLGNDVYMNPDGSREVHYRNGDTAFMNADGQYHKNDGPAYISADGEKTWYHKGQMHNTDGPAYVDESNGTQFYYLEGQQVHPEDYQTYQDTRQHHQKEFDKLQSMIKEWESYREAYGQAQESGDQKKIDEASAQVRLAARSVNLQSKIVEMKEEKERRAYKRCLPVDHRVNEQLRDLGKNAHNSASREVANQARKILQHGENPRMVEQELSQLGNEVEQSRPANDAPQKEWDDWSNKMMVVRALRRAI